MCFGQLLQGAIHSLLQDHDFLILLLSQVLQIVIGVI